MISVREFSFSSEVIKSIPLMLNPMDSAGYSGSELHIKEVLSVILSR
jgi:hypothetical protein